MPTRVLIIQPTLAGYRVPVFRELARRPGIELKVIYASTPRRPNAQPEGFVGIYQPMWQRHLRGHPLNWQQSQWDHATRRHADVLILNWDVHYLSLVPALLRARTNGLPTILWGHGYSKHDDSIRRLPRQALARLATALLFYNQTGAEKYRALGISPRRIFVAPNSLDQAPIQLARRHWLDDPQRLQQFKLQHALDRGPVLLFVSRLDPLRRLDVLLHAVKHLQPHHPSLQLIIIGTGPMEQELRTLARDMSIQENVRFLGPIYDEMQLAPWFLSADIYTYPSYMGLSLLHAFGYGLPVVTGDDHAAHGPEIEALQPEHNGLMFTAGDPGAMATAIDQLLRDRPQRAALAAGALRTVQDRFTMNRMIEGFEAAIRSCAARRSHGSD